MDTGSILVNHNICLKMIAKIANRRFYFALYVIRSLRSAVQFAADQNKKLPQIIHQQFFIVQIAFFELLYHFQIQVLVFRKLPGIKDMFCQRDSVTF